MRDTPSPATERPGASSPPPSPLQVAGRRSGEGSASVLEYLIQDRARYSDRGSMPKEQRG